MNEKILESMEKSLANIEEPAATNGRRRARDPAEEAVATAARDRHELLQRAETAEAEVARWSAHAQQLNADLENAGRVNAKLQNERDHFLRRVTELETNHAAAVQLLNGSAATREGNL